MRLYLKNSIIVLLILALTGCAYYNTFFNAEENYRIGLEKKANNDNEKLPPDITRHFNASIAKSWTIIDFYGDSSRWADDALLMIGKAHYQLEEYDKSQEVLEQFLQKYFKSELIPEVELWLAKVYLKKDESENALKRLTSITNNSVNDELKAEAFYQIGEIHFASGQYETAILNFQNCINETSDSETAGNAQYKLADSYYKLQQFEKAIESYDEVLDYELPILIQFDAVTQMANSLIELQQFERAEKLLLNILRDQRFKAQYSLIATKLANMLEFQGEYQYAMEKYYEVIDDYPRTEGSALAAFYLAQLYEFAYGELDSAKIKYDQVKKEYSKSESVEEATKRSKLLADYIKVRDGIKKDRLDLFKLEHGDSLLVDSLVTSIDTVIVPSNQTNTDDPLNANFDRFRQQDSLLAKDSVNSKNLPSKKVKETKVAVSRDPKSVEASFLKNSYNLAEYFLLEYQHYDSALVAYIFFVNNFQDSLLTPKAYYSLFYIYNDIKKEKEIADSLKNLILTEYPESIYARQLSGKLVVSDEKTDQKVKNKFLAAEKLLYEKKFNEAIKSYKEIAEQDSGSVWATKSRYAIGYVYENFLADTTNAIKSYSVLVKEYPNSSQGKIATKKIADPPKEESVPEQNMSVDSLLDQRSIEIPDTSENIQ